MYDHASEWVGTVKTTRKTILFRFVYFCVFICFSFSLDTSMRRASTSSTDVDAMVAQV